MWNCAFGFETRTEVAASAVNKRKHTGIVQITGVLCYSRHNSLRISIRFESARERGLFDFASNLRRLFEISDCIRTKFFDEHGGRDSA